MSDADPVAFPLQARVPARKPTDCRSRRSYGHAIDAGVPNHVEACLGIKQIAAAENDVVARDVL